VNNKKIIIVLRNGLNMHILVPGFQLQII